MRHRFDPGLFVFSAVLLAASIAVLFAFLSGFGQGPLGDGAAVWFGTAGGLTLAIGFPAFMTRIRKARFEVLEDGGGEYTFRTDTGTFRADGRSSRVRIDPRRGPAFSVPFDEIAGLEFRFGETSALLTEVLVGGWDWTLFFPRYHNHDVRFTILLVLREEDRRIPLFVAEKYEFRDVFPVMPALLSLMGLNPHVDDLSRRVLEAIRSGFARAGLEAPMVVS